MGVSGKHPLDGGLESDGKKWAFLAGIQLRPPLKPIYTVPIDCRDKGAGDEDEECSTTPTAVGARIPAILPCPPPPKKRKPSLKCNYGGAREFFNPPDLETIFARHVERAN